MSPKLFSYLFVALSLLPEITPSAYANYNYSQLDDNFYNQSCPRLPMIVRNGIMTARQNDGRIAASLLRLHAHDCLVNGCDASILLDDTSDFKGEKNASPNQNSLRGFEVINSIKADVETYCPLTVSCADILALAAREAVSLSGGPSWSLPLGRRDGLTASGKAANEQLPSNTEPLDNIIAKFTSKGLDLKDVVALSGGHTIGFARCFRGRDFDDYGGIFRPDPLRHRGRDFGDYGAVGGPDPVHRFSAEKYSRTRCRNLDESNSDLAPLDAASVNQFDNHYYANLVNNNGFLQSDRALMADPRTAPMVKSYNEKQNLFFSDFGTSMVKMGNIGVLTGENGQIRKKCWAVN